MTRALRAAACILLMAVAFRVTVSGFVALSDLHEKVDTTIPAVVTTDTGDRIQSRPVERLRA